MQTEFTNCYKDSDERVELDSLMLVSKSGMLMQTYASMDNAFLSSMQYILPEVYTTVLLHQVVVRHCVFSLGQPRATREHQEREIIPA